VREQPPASAGTGGEKPLGVGFDEEGPRRLFRRPPPRPIGSIDRTLQLKPQFLLERAVQAQNKTSYRCRNFGGASSVGRDAQLGICSAGASFQPAPTGFDAEFNLDSLQLSTREEHPKLHPQLGGNEPAVEATALVDTVHACLPPIAFGLKAPSVNNVYSAFGGIPWNSMGSCQSDG